MTLTTYQPGNDIVVEVDVPVDGKNHNSASYVVTDPEVGVIVPVTATSFSGTGSKISITIPAAENVVPEGAVRAMRVVQVTFENATGYMHRVDVRYVIQRADRLVVMDNSFQTIEEALLTRMDLPALDGWDAATEDERIAALSTAFDRMCRATYRYRMGQDALEYAETAQYWYVSDMRLRTLDEFVSYPTHFRKALLKAQIYEADSVLAGDPVGDKRLEGIISETIGEAKMFFSNTPPVRTPLCREAMSVLGPFLYRSTRIARA